MAALTITRLRALNGFGVFQQCSSADLHAFSRYNLIYGFNGSGKSTLTRVLSSLQAGELHSELPTNGRFEVELSTGAVLSDFADCSILKDRMTVFNASFVEQNLRWAEGRANPIFYLGRLQSESAARLEALEADLSNMDTNRLLAFQHSESAEAAFVEFKRNTARLISEQLNLGRKYDASNLASDIQNNVLFTLQPLDEEDKRSRRSVIMQDAPLPILQQVPLPERNFEAFYLKIDDLLRTTLADISIAALIEHQEMLPWIKKGLDFHIDHKQHDCLFCGNRLVDGRIESLEKVINASYSRLVTEIEVASSELLRLESRRAAILGRLPSQNDIVAVHRTDFARAISGLELLYDEATAFTNASVELLKTKLKSINTKLSADDTLNLAQAKRLDSGIRDLTYEINQTITRHNEAFDQFEKLREDARTQLKMDILREFVEKYRKKESEVIERKQASQNSQDDMEDVIEEIQAIKADLRKHGPAAETINHLIRGYLGHSELEISTLDEGYEIRRLGVAITGPLSDGEKTAIALCYFLSNLEAEGRKLKDTIVVVDDPISSLDTKALHYASAMLKGLLSNAAQVVILTHNLQFMNEIKKWLKPKLDKGDASLMFLECSKSGSGVKRNSRLVKLPTLLREHDSEYHYLFSLVLKFVESEAPSESEYLYLMPNAMRKLLDIFLAFKAPGSDGLASKVDTIAKQVPDLASSVRAIDRLVQVESHADSLDDLTSLSSMTIEETVEAARSLCSLMQTLDAEHFRKLKRVCS